MGKVIRGDGPPGHLPGALSRVEGENNAPATSHKGRKGGWVGGVFGPVVNACHPLRSEPEPRGIKAGTRATGPSRPGQMTTQLSGIGRADTLPPSPVKQPNHRSGFRRNPRSGNDLMGLCPATPRRDITQTRVVIQTV